MFIMDDFVMYALTALIHYAKPLQCVYSSVLDTAACIYAGNASRRKLLAPASILK